MNKEQELLDRGFKPMMLDNIEESTRYLINKSGDVFDLVYGKFILKQFVGGSRNTGKYLGLNIWQNNGIRTILYVHRLVAFTFLNYDRERQEVNHKDGDKTNNHVSNLEWCTRSENLKHYFASPLYQLRKRKKNQLK